MPFPLARLRAFDVDGYISRRRSEGAADTTVSKELVVLRKSLRRRGGHPGRVLARVRAAEARAHRGRAQEAPRRVAHGPRRSRRVHRRDVRLLARDGAGSSRRRQQGPRDGAPARDEAEDALPDGADREPAQQSLLAYALEHAKGEDEALFLPWGNVRRDLADACEEARIDRCSPNDLRRTFASWQVEAGVPLFPIAQAMGHKDTRMLERVYGRQTPEQLAAIMARAMGLTQGVCSTFVAAPLDSAGSRGPDGLGDTADARDAASPKNSEAQRTSQSSGPRMFERVEVPGAGIEPATRGFSVPCSTD